MILDDLQLGIMETSWTESKDKLTRQRYKLYTEEGKEDGLNIVFAVCERQELESEETAYGSDYKWGSPTRIIQEELNIMNRLKNRVTTSDRFVNHNQIGDDQDLATVDGNSANENYTSGGAKFLKNNPYGSNETIQIEPRTDDVSIGDFRSQAQVINPNNEVSLRALKDNSSMERTDQKVSQNISTPLPQAARENIATNQNSLNSEFVSVGRGNFYLTIENSYSTSWKLTEQTIRRSGMAIER